MTVARKDFVERYRQLIEGRQFVEYRDYYKNSVNRFWSSFDRIQRLNLPPGAKVIDIGGGIMAVLLAKILGLDAAVGDVNRRGFEDVAGHKVRFHDVDLLSDQRVPDEQFDLVVLQEVIEHLPQPPYIVFDRISKFMKPGGILFLTTPNGSRMRNILYLLAGRRVLDNFRYPAPQEALGHQQEYTLSQLLWHLDRAGMRVDFGEQYDDGWAGASMQARAMHALLKPANLVPHLRNGLMIAARRPAS
jgi:2-polyprenyl-3-methyl-5-hydroxy-6-metoxy-1,4-benzoquinol methylase